MCLFSPCTGQIPRKNAVPFASPSLPILTFDTEAVSIFPGQNTRFVKRPVTPIPLIPWGFVGQVLSKVEGLVRPILTFDTEAVSNFPGQKVRSRFALTGYLAFRSPVYLTHVPMPRVRGQLLTSRGTPALSEWCDDSALASVSSKARILVKQ